MNGPGDQPDDLDVRIRWPRGYGGAGGDPADLEDELPTTEPDPRLRRRSPRRARRATEGEPTTEDPGPTPPATAPAEAIVPSVPDPDLANRIDRLGTALTDIIGQIADLSAQTTTLSDLVQDRLAGASPDGDPSAASTSGLSIQRYQQIQDEATAEILEAVEGNETTGRRVEQVMTALSVELAEVAQTLSDQAGRDSQAANDEMRAGFSRTTADVEALGESVADSLAQVAEQLHALTVSRGPAEGRKEADDGLVAETAAAVSRIETVVEDLLTAADERPTDVSELTARTLERLGLTVGARLEAATTTAVEATKAAVDKAIDRATDQFKEITPPVADRSTTAAITRLEERIASLTRQRDEHDRETKTTLNHLEETVSRLASAQAEDLERIVDTIEATTGAPSGTAGKSGGIVDERLDRIEAALADLADLPSTTDELADNLAEQFVAFNTQMEAVRRRLSLRARPGVVLDERALQQLADLVAERVGPLAIAKATTRTRASKPARAAAPRRARAATPAPPPAGGAKPTKATKPRPRDGPRPRRPAE